MMKVFVYSKVDSRKIATLTDVVSVFSHDKTITFVNSDGIEMTFYTKKVKTTTYQN